MNADDAAMVRQIFREELRAFFGEQGQRPADAEMDAQEMARLILGGRGDEVKRSQHLKLTGKAA